MLRKILETFSLSIFSSPKLRSGVDTSGRLLRASDVPFANSEKKKNEMPESRRIKSPFDARLAQWK